MRSRQWHPLNTVDRSRPETGQLVAFRHAVWRTVKVENSTLTDKDRDVWLERGMPDLDRWHQRPYKVTVAWVGGAPPEWAANGDDRKRGTIHIPAGDRQQWNVYPRGRWPQCSCCGEPVPCRGRTMSMYARLRPSSGAPKVPSRRHSGTLASALVMPSTTQSGATR